MLLPGRAYSVPTLTRVTELMHSVGMNTGNTLSDSEKTSRLISVLEDLNGEPFTEHMFPYSTGRSKTKQVAWIKASPEKIDKYFLASSNISLVRSNEPKNSTWIISNLYIRILCSPIPFFRYRSVKRNNQSLNFLQNTNRG